MNEQDKKDLKEMLNRKYGKVEIKTDPSPKVVKEKSKKRDKYRKIKKSLGCGCDSLQKD